MSDQKKIKTINEYEKIRNEYAKLQKEKSKLKIELKKYQNYIQNKSQRSYQKLSYQKSIRKRKHYYYNDPEESEDVILMLQKFRDNQKNNEKE